VCLNGVTVVSDYCRCHNLILIFLQEVLVSCGCSGVEFWWKKHKSI